ncbi:hypothetical protein [Streptomyces lateritius]|uniref:hypothetical protein n=1 Tax=Streptomyces lateritius TaxID=67313 RepID=UPI001E601B1E|nr:hypothetical protein [Streptomyces lateritius]
MKSVQGAVHIQETFPFTFGHFETLPGEGPNGSEDDVVDLQMIVLKKAVDIDGRK